MVSSVRHLIGLIILSGFLISPPTIFAQRIEEDIRIDLPADGQIRVENRFGSVSAEVWANSYVSVSASLSTGPRARRSPILIDNRGKLLLISVSRSPSDQISVIDVKVKVPASAHLEIVTTAGSISLSGLTAGVSLKSVSGNIASNLSDAADVTINARASQGSIKSTLAAQPENDGRVLQTRLGSGAKSLELQTESGQISLIADAGGERAAKEPALVAPNRAAGTPEKDSANEEVSEGDVIRVDSQLVTLNMSVIDRGTNRGLVGLRQSDFRLFEDGEEQNIVQFESSSAPFDLFLLIDLSGSTRDVIKLIRAAARRFVEAARPSDRIAVITFAGEPAIVSTLTLDRDLLKQRISTIDTARGDTKLYDATEFTMSLTEKEPKKSRRTAVVLMSDGLDGTIPGVSGQTGSVKPYAEVLKSIQEFDGVLYTLWLNTRYVAMNPQDTQPEAFDEGYDRMGEMADAGGGIFYEVKRLEDLAGAYEQVVADLGTVYSLAYRPTKKTRDGKWRSIRVSVPNRSNAVARGKRGYYAN